VSACKSGSARDIFDTKAMLAFAQSMLAAPDGGIRIVLPQLDDLRFRVIEQTMAGTARKKLVRDALGERICEQLVWTVEGHAFSVRGPWRIPTMRDAFKFDEQKENEERV
jgi:hypothetical protein